MTRPAPTIDDLLVALDLAVPLRLPRLRRLYGDPTQALVNFIGSLPAEERARAELPPRPYVIALCILGELRTFGAIGCLLSCLDWRSDDIHRLAIRAVGQAGDALVEPAALLWPVLGRYARGLVAECLGRNRLRDERVFRNLLAWADEDPFHAALALGEYGDDRAVPRLSGLLVRSLASQDQTLTAEVIASMQALGVLAQAVSRKL